MNIGFLFYWARAEIDAGEEKRTGSPRYRSMGLWGECYKCALHEDYKLYCEGQPDYEGYYLQTATLLG